MRRPLLLDLFCKAGGAGMGYARAGFEVVGVDIEPQKRYPFEFVRADAIDFALRNGSCFDAIHASPPCQNASVTSSFPWTRAAKGEIPHLIEPTREVLVATGRPYVIENVVGADLIAPIMLCGLSFDLKVFRHRLFESNVFLLTPPHINHGERRVGVNGFCCVAGHGDCALGRRNKVTGEYERRGPRIPKDHRTVDAWRRAMGIEWMTRNELAEAIPPAYTEFIGRQLREQG